MKVVESKFDKSQDHCLIATMFVIIDCRTNNCFPSNNCRANNCYPGNQFWEPESDFGLPKFIFWFRKLILARKRL